MAGRVILCCVKLSKEFSNDFEKKLQEYFSQFGVVKKIQAFCTKVLTKPFVEFETLLGAKSAIINSKTIPFTQGKLRVFPSHKISVDNSKEYAKHFRQEKEKEEKLIKRELENQLKAKYELRSKPNQGNSPYSFPNQEDQFTQFQQNREENCFRKPDAHMSSDVKPQFPVCASFRPPLAKRSDHSAIHPQLNGPATTSPCSPTQSKKVLLMQKLTSPLFTPKTIANIFGCFGNVVKILHNKKSNFALIEMEDHNHAQICLQVLDKETLFGNKMKLKFSNYPYLSFKGLVKENNPDVEFLTELRKNHRYRPLLNIKPNPPSCFLHLTAIPDSFDPFLISMMVQDIATPNEVVLLRKKGINSRMYLLEFKSKEECFAVLGEMHNYQVDDRIIKFSFSQK